jgi:hypothetical protein
MFLPMNKLFIILLFIPFFADAQVGMLLRPLEEEAQGTPSGPGLISDLKIWFRADTLVTYPSNEVTHIGNIVTGEDFMYQDGQNSISYQAGQTTMQFTQTGQFQLLPSPNYLFTGDTITVIILHDPSTTGIQDMIYLDDQSTYGTKVQVSKNGVQIRSDRSGNYSYYTGFYLTSKALFYVEIPVADLVDSRVEVNGTQYNPQWAFGSQVMTTNVNKILFGRLNSGVFYELCVYDRALTSSEKTFINQYFTDRYGL